VRRGTDRWILTIALTLSILGSLMVFSSSTAMTASTPDFRNDPYFFLKRQLISLGVGLVAMLVARRIDLLKFRGWTGLPFMLATITTLIAVLIVGPEINGAQRWIALGPFQFQPAEMAKLAMIFYLADCLDRRREKVTYLSRIIPALGLFGVTLVLVEQEPDLGTALVIAAVFMGMLFVAGAKMEHLGAMAAAGVIAVAAAAIAKPFRMKRLTNYLDPTADVQGSGYQLYQSLLAVASGGLVGVGLGNSHQKFNYLPELHTDFIYAILCEELGLLGAGSVALLFLCLLFKGFKVAVQCRRPYLRLLAAGATFQIVVQAWMNMMVVTGAIPTTGVPLPFISYGGSSLLFSLIAVGLLLNVSDYNAQYGQERDKPQKREKRIRAGATLTSSNEDKVVPVGCGAWERQAAGQRLKRKESSLPRPAVEPRLTQAPERRKAPRQRRGA